MRRQLRQLLLTTAFTAAAMGAGTVAMADGSVLRVAAPEARAEILEPVPLT